MILHSSICLSHKRPNQLSEQIHANLRAELGTVVGDSTQSPCAPHGFTGLHNDEPSVVELGSIVVEDCDDDVVSGQEVVDEDHDGVAVGQEDVGEGHEIVGTDGVTIDRNKTVFFW